MFLTVLIHNTVVMNVEFQDTFDTFSVIFGQCLLSRDSKRNMYVRKTLHMATLIRIAARVSNLEKSIWETSVPII